MKFAKFGAATFVAGLGLFLLLLPLGCGKRNSETAASGGAAPAPPSNPFEHLNDGPRAAQAGPADHVQAERGEKLFQTKGCTACHAFGRRGTGPDLSGVSDRRTGAWIQSQILHPFEMVKGDSTAHSLFATYAVQMPNLTLSSEEARSLLEFVKEKDKKHASAH